MVIASGVTKKKSTEHGVPATPSTATATAPLPLMQEEGSANTAGVTPGPSTPSVVVVEQEEEQPMKEQLEESHRWEYKGLIKEPIKRRWTKEWRTFYISHCAHCGITKCSPGVYVDYHNDEPPVPPPEYREPVPQRRRNPYPL